MRKLERKFLRLIKARGYAKSEAFKILLAEIHSIDLQRIIKLLES
ncbi:MAG: hypothetical protein ACRD1P_11585 [Thermoanaerobaculia bacterium]